MSVEIERVPEELVVLSREYGADARFVLAGGGNTSVKRGGTLYVKASGSSLAEATPESFVALNLAATRAVAESSFSADPQQREEQVKGALSAAKLDRREEKRPSVEAVLHALLPQRFVVHTHPRRVNGLACATGGREACRRLFGDEIPWLDYTDPGFTLAKFTAEQTAAYRAAQGREPAALIMQNHGLFVGGATPAEVRETTLRLMEKLEAAYAAAGVGECFPEEAALSPDEAWEILREAAAALRGATAPDGRVPGPVVAVDDSPLMRAFVAAPEGKAAAGGGPYTPDQIVYCRSFPLWFTPREGESSEARGARLGREVRAYREKHGILPTVVLLERVGLLAVGETPRAARTAARVYADAARITALTRTFGGPRFLSARERGFIESWESEHYRRRAATTGPEAAGRMRGRVAVVTGAAQGFGEGLAYGLAGEGAYVVVADVNFPGARRTAAALVEKHGAERAVAVEMNVADGASVKAAMEEVVRAYGGLDILVVNAGILRAGSVKTQPEEEFAAVTAVNYRGYFHCVKYAAPLLAAAHAAAPNYRTDIVQINSKSGLVGSARNAAYAGGKFGGLGLTQSFALELVADGVKVNSICPGNFFDGPLWSNPENGLFVQYLKAGKVPGAKTVEEVRRFYEEKVPMRRGCTVEDVVRALFYVIEQEYETGQAVPVTGGQVMLS